MKTETEETNKKYTFYFHVVQPHLLTKKSVGFIWSGKWEVEPEIHNNEHDDDVIVENYYHYGIMSSNILDD